MTLTITRRLYHEIVDNFSSKFLEYISIPIEKKRNKCFEMNGMNLCCIFLRLRFILINPIQWMCNVNVMNGDVNGLFSTRLNEI